ncbi:glycosyltransferase family 4 protein [Agromyces larvae]|uniref:Glycosyltransferase family 4 protein n=1 Tax=Agromyces larvae TaxID=2929802 RepID=A0ABY4BVH4_9MICO|nr:glycosyltransferase family 4 protein [Agromyces larvae]UOE42749.1 glycosyltransferase family 4 protein [Agromyces larvae]
MKRDGVSERRVRKILLIAPACDGEDISEAWNAFQWARLLSERFELTVIASYKKGHTPLSKQLSNARVIEWSEPPFVSRFERLNSLMQPGYAPFYFRARRWIRRQLASGEQFDLAHQVVPVAMRYPSPAAGLGIPFVIGPVGGSLLSPPAFVCEEGATPWYQRLRGIDRFRLKHDRSLRATYESADCVVGIAPYVRDVLSDSPIRRFESMSEVALHEVQPPIDRARRAGPVRLLHVGRTIRTKGLRDVIRALAELRDLSLVLDVLGDGNDRAACEALVHELGLGDRVTFHGMVARAAVDEFYREADIFVFPSYREPGGGVVLEALSHGLPLILADRGGPAAFVDDASAIRVPAVTPEQLARDCAAAIRSLVEDPALRIRMGEAARSHAASHHLWRHRLDQMGRYYEQVARPVSQ